jgi:hypothetical protein
VSVASRKQELFELSESQRGLFAAYRTTALPPAVRFYELGPTVRTEDLEDALERCRLAEPALRLKLVQVDEGWRQSFTDRRVGLREIATTDPNEPIARRHAAAAIAAVPAGEAGPSPLSALLVGDPVGPGRRILALLVDRYAIDGRGFDILEQRIDQQLISPSGPARDREDRARPLIEPPAGGGLEGGATAMTEGLLEATLATGAPPCGDPASPRRETVRTELDPDWADGLAAAGISPAMAFVGAQALLLGEATSSPAAVVNVPLADRSLPARRDIVGRFVTLTHLPIAIPSDTTVGEFRKGIRRAMLTAIRLRRVDLTVVYRGLYENLPTWPPGWNSICSVFDQPRWDGSEFLRPLDLDFWDPSNEAPGMLVANVRSSATSVEANWIWDANWWPDGSGQRFQRLAWRLCTASARAPLSSLTEEE